MTLPIMIFWSSFCKATCVAQQGKSLHVSDCITLEEEGQSYSADIWLQVIECI